MMNPNGHGGAHLDPIAEQSRVVQHTKQCVPSYARTNTPCLSIPRTASTMAMLGHKTLTNKHRQPHLRLRPGSYPKLSKASSPATERYDHTSTSSADRFAIVQAW